MLHLLYARSPRVELVTYTWINSYDQRMTDWR